MGYQGGSLKGFVSAAAEVTPLAAFAMADAGWSTARRRE